MKKFLSVLVILCLLFCLTACGNSATHTDAENDDLQVDEYTSQSGGTTVDDTTVHTHNYKDATCTEAAKCSCGETNGTARGHQWKDATCKSPKTCTTCGVTEGNNAQHNMNGEGVCNACGQDVFLQFVKENVSLNLIVPSVGASDNYYCEVKFINHTGYNMTLTRFVTANGKMCDNASAKDYLLETDYSVKISFYRATVPADRWEDRYKDMYLDNNSTATTSIKVNGRQAVIKFGTNGIIDVGNTINEID